MKKITLLFIFLIILIPFSSSEGGVFKVCRDGKVLSIKEVEQLCFIDVEKSKTQQEIFIRFELIEKNSDCEYFLIILPVPAFVQNIQFKRPVLIDYFNLFPMVCTENVSSVLSLFNFAKKNYFPQLSDQKTYIPFFNVHCKEEEEEIKRNPFGTIIKKYKIQNMPNKYEIIQSTSINELKLYFKSNNEKLPDETYNYLSKYIKDFSFFIARTNLPVKLKHLSTYEGIFQDKGTESIYLLDKDFTLSRQELLVNNYMDIHLTFPCSTIYCPLPICASEADNIFSLTLVINNIVYLNNFMYKFFFDVKHYYSNACVRAKIPFKQTDEFSKTIGYTVINTKNNMNNVPLADLSLIFSSQKLAQEVSILFGFLFALFIVTKSFLKYDYFESTIISALVLFFTFWGSILPIVSIMLLICSMNFLKEKFSLSTFNKIHLFFFIMLIYLSLYDVLISSFHVQVFFAVAVITYGLYMQRRGLAYIVLTALSSSCFIFLLNEFLKFFGLFAF